jgi:cytochrome c oxidase subunit 3
MTTIPAGPDYLPRPETRPYWQRYRHAGHFRSNEAEFDAVKLGMWLFLATEVLLFAGMFCAYAVFRMLYPEAWHNGSGYLDWKWGCFNTIVLLVSSFTVAMSIHNAQKNQQGWLKFNLAFTLLCAIAFVSIKLLFEYTPKWSGWFFFLDPSLPHYKHAIEHAGGHVTTGLGGLFTFIDGYGGKRPGSWFVYGYSDNPYEPIWWSVYYVATGIHATHVLVGVGLISWLLVRASRGHFGPGHYTAVEIGGLYWHIVDMIWIFLFPLLYLIH